MSMDIALALQQEAERLIEENRPAEAALRLREAIARFEEAEGPDSPDVANLSNQLAQLLVQLGRHDEAEAAAARALAIIEPLLDRFEGPEGEQVRIESLTILGTVA